MVRAFEVCWPCVLFQSTVTPDTPACQMHSSAPLLSTRKATIPFKPCVRLNSIMLYLRDSNEKLAFVMPTCSWSVRWPDFSFPAACKPGVLRSQLLPIGPSGLTSEQHQACAACKQFHAICIESYHFADQQNFQKESLELTVLFLRHLAVHAAGHARGLNAPEKSQLSKRLGLSRTHVLHAGRQWFCVAFVTVELLHAVSI